MTAARPAAAAAAGRARAVSRPTELTRRALVDAATAVFAEHGFQAGSVRLITAKAKANQAAITYHFGGKDDLYRAVLRAAIAAFEERSLLDERTVETVSPEEGLRLLMRQLLIPLVKRDRLSSYMRIFGWESAQPSKVFQDFMATETPPIFAIADRLVRRFLGEDASAEELAITVFWLVEQPIAFVRSADRLAGPPFNILLDSGSVDRLVDRLADLALKGLANRS